MSLDYIRHLIAYSDGVLYALALLLLVALAVMVDRFWYLRRTILHGGRIVRLVGETSQLGGADLETLAHAAGALPEAAVLSAARQHLGAGPDALEGHLDEIILLLAPRVDRGLWMLDTIVTLAPLLGLFGTIIGMFHAFSVLSAPGHAPTAITAGVADALVATAMGIFIAMLGLVGFNALSNRVRIVLLQLDTVKMMVMNRIGTDSDVAGRHLGSRMLHAVAGE